MALHIHSSDLYDGLGADCPGCSHPLHCQPCRSCDCTRDTTHVVVKVAKKFRFQRDLLLVLLALLWASCLLLVFPALGGMWENAAAYLYSATAGAVLFGMASEIWDKAGGPSSWGRR